MKNDTDIIPLLKPKVIKKTQPIIENINEYMKNLIVKDDFQESWNTVENQYNFRLFISEKKISIKKLKIVDDVARKEKVKEKILKRKKIPEPNNKPKQPYFFFKNEEALTIQKEFPLFTKTEIHHDLQKKWKNIKKNEVEKYNYYNELAKTENTERLYLKTLEPTPIQNITKTSKTLRREKHEKKVLKKAEKKTLKIKNNLPYKRNDNEDIKKLIKSKNLPESVFTDKKDIVSRFIDHRKKV